MEVKHIPATHDGIAAFNIQNALAAAAIAFGMNIEIDIIRAGLSNFGSSYEENPGRFNIFDGHGFRVILDYAHNPAALKAFLQMVDNMRGNYRNVIGTVSTPGDRRDEDIREMGRIAATGLDFIVFREDPDRRGRSPGVVNRLLKEGALSAGFPTENIVCVGPEEEATDICLKKAAPGDLVILTPSNVSGMWERMLAFKPESSLLYNTQLIRPPVYDGR
jgi:cyanophycin synthetase